MNIPNGATHFYDATNGVRLYLKEIDNIFYGYIDICWVKINDSEKYLEEIKPITDPINHPTHYTQGKVECIDAIESATVGKNGFEAYCVGNVIKYLWRYEKKGGKESVEKAKWYLEKLLEKMK
ncbi:MAG: hypothetical protein [Caudoviricetes sp.]|nr:MAG: hypothetical protein [Caudoviricetes sp.]